MFKTVLHNVYKLLPYAVIEKGEQDSMNRL